MELISKAPSFLFNRISQGECDKEIKLPSNLRRIRTIQVYSLEHIHSNCVYIASMTYHNQPVVNDADNIFTLLFHFSNLLSFLTK